MRKTNKRISTLLFVATLLLISFSVVYSAQYHVPIPDFSLASSDYPQDSKNVKEPLYKGGHDAMVKFLSENIKYPDQAKKEGISGIVYVSCLITKEGKISEVKVKKGVNEILDREAVRVVSMLKEWEPGTADGKKVDASIVIPINFKLSDK